MANCILLTNQAIILLNAVHFENIDLLAKSPGKAIYLGPAGGVVGGLSLTVLRTRLSQSNLTQGE